MTRPVPNGGVKFKVAESGSIQLNNRSQTEGDTKVKGLRDTSVVNSIPNASQPPPTKASAKGLLPEGHQAPKPHQNDKPAKQSSVASKRSAQNDSSTEKFRVQLSAPKHRNQVQPLSERADQSSKWNKVRKMMRIKLFSMWKVSDDPLDGIYVNKATLRFRNRKHQHDATTRYARIYPL
jgi:hypothetical protein